MSPMVLASEVASGIGIVAGMVMFKSLMTMENAKGPISMDAKTPRCPTCKGTRKVECVCKRWSDGDHGCSTCSHTGMRICTSCGGSGRGRHIPVKLHVSSSSSSRNLGNSSYPCLKAQCRTLHHHK